MNEEKKQRARENAKRYYQKNKEKILKRQKEYVKKRYREDEEFRKKVKEKNRNYVINNPEKAREIKRKSQYKYINKKRLSGELPLTQKMLIDNLQQENQQLKEQIQELSRMCELYGKSLYNADLKKAEERIEKAIEYIENYDVFKEFNFPLMKRDEENQIKSSIKYEFDTSIKKDLLSILKGEEK